MSKNFSDNHSPLVRERRQWGRPYGGGFGGGGGGFGRPYGGGFGPRVIEKETIIRG